MADVITVYISAAADLELEREILNRSITEIPTTLAWRILQTPMIAHEPDLIALAGADIHLLLLGGDVRAPVGVEWDFARRNRRLPILYRRTGIIRTMAGQAFERELARYAAWNNYASAVDIRRKFLLLVSKTILARRSYFSLSADEYDKLSEWRKTLKNSKQNAVDQTRGGAGNNSVILSAERFTPSDGVLLRDPRATVGEGDDEAMESG